MNVRISQKISISLNPALCARAHAAAAEHRVAFSWLVARALEHYLDEPASAETPEMVRKKTRNAPAASLGERMETRLAAIEAALARIEAQGAAPTAGRTKTNRARYRGADDVGFLALKPIGVGKMMRQARLARR